MTIMRYWGQSWQERYDCFKRKEKVMFTKIKVFYMLLKCKLFNKLKIFTPGNIYYIGGTESLPPPLSIDEEKILLNQIKNNSAEVRSILIERNLRLVVYLSLIHI